MSIPTMNNEQFALWIAIQTNRIFTLEKADDIYKWLENKAKKSDTPKLPKGK